ncbi:RTA1 like protein-domain-containing protein [Coniochaeta sp. 2T2.1]|nr:RTA1 like protein-domain-containing protein [Coniochaeta sp. 2T2.1]
MEDGIPVEGSIWIYAPNKGAPIFFAVAFAVSGCVHVWQCIHYHSWRLTGLLVFVSINFVAGFIVRELGAFDMDNLVKYIVSIVLIYIAPPLYELANYYVLGRILYYIPYLSPMHPGRVLSTFAAISVVVETLNGLGASYSANTSLPRDKQELGHSLFKAALIIQLFVIACFLSLAVTFHLRCRRAGIKHNRNLYKALHTLYASQAILTVRTIYRVVEYWSVAELHIVEGFDTMTLSPLLRYEWFFYVFEASLMLGNQVLLNVRHPRMFLPQSTKTYLDRDGVTEVTGPGYDDKRPFWVTLLDPFDVGGMIKASKKESRFWEGQEEGQIRAQGTELKGESRTERGEVV